jgi:hypothetical protein
LHLLLGLRHKPRNVPLELLRWIATGRKRKHANIVLSFVLLLNIFFRFFRPR